jgi:hypothetical protein
MHIPLFKFIIKLLTMVINFLSRALLLFDRNAQDQKLHEIINKRVCDLVQEVAAFLDNSKKARRLNNHVFSLLHARSPHADKLASMIKQNGSVLHLFKYPIIPSIVASLALRGPNPKTLKPFSKQYAMFPSVTPQKLYPKLVHAFCSPFNLVSSL